MNIMQEVNFAREWKKKVNLVSKMSVIELIETYYLNSKQVMKLSVWEEVFYSMSFLQKMGHHYAYQTMSTIFK